MNNVEFRAKRLDNGKLIYGCYFIQEHCVAGELSNHFYIGKNLDDYTEIDPATLEQKLGENEWGCAEERIEELKAERDRWMVLVEKLNKDNMELQTDRFIKALNSTEEITKLKNTLKLHAGDCCSLNNEVEQLRSNADDNLAAYGRLEKENKGLRDAYKILLVDVSVSQLDAIVKEVSALNPQKGENNE